MKRMTSICLAAILGVGAAVNAQTAQSKKSVNSPAGSSGTVTLVGCLEQGKLQGRDGPAFMLSMGTPAASSGAVGTSGSNDATAAAKDSSPAPVGTSGIAASAQRVQLVSTDGYDLGDAVNQRVEVTGALTTHGNVRTLNVKNIRSVAATCNSSGK